MTQDERRAAGLLFDPLDPQLKAQKGRAHALSRAYSATDESDTQQRAEILSALFAAIGDHAFIQGPLFVHYGVHTRIGTHFFGNYDLTIQDDAEVTIGDHCDFGPKVTIVTPLHPMLADEREALPLPGGAPRRLCWARPVHIGDRCWFGAGVTVCPGVTIGSGCVIGAGSVVTRDIPANSFAAGVPCRVIRTLTAQDSVLPRTELWQTENEK